jgi:hypothetical protein
MTGQWHPDVTALAEYRAGLTGGRRARRLAAHVASCADCESVNDQLAAVTTVLASAPEPVMPDAVESRIMAALATEAALVTETPHDTEASPATEAVHGTAAKRDTALRPVGGDGGRRSRRRPGGGRSGPGNRWLRPAVLASAAAACLVLFGGVYGITHLSSGSSSSSAASSAAGSAAAGSESSPLAGPQAPGTRLEPAHSAPVAAFTVTASGTNYLPATLALQVRAQLARSGKAALPAAEAAPSAQLSACVLHLTGQLRPMLVDRATYQGKPAYVIAVTNRAWVVGTGCTASNPELIASVGL